VVGLARSGIAAARALQARGERVVAVDAGFPDVPDGIEAHLRTDGMAFLPHARAVVKSPGVPREAPVIAAARARGIPVLGELELGWRLLGNEFIAVTGTNGKTTTVELLGHIHREAGLAVAVAGNVGAALSGLVGALSPEAVVVCEASSFQLEDTLAFAPEGAVLVNVQADHLDRHGTFEDYLSAKLRIFRFQGNEDVADAPVHLILGGVGKGQDFSALRGRASRSYLIGEAAGQLAREVGGEACGDLETAVARARAAAAAGDVVLLSPACASFDQFADYEARGRAFKALVGAR
jgi:UDP-N-acetylmuramoylalanine--D-glutamate ligase